MYWRRMGLDVHAPPHSSKLNYHRPGRRTSNVPHQYASYRGRCNHLFGVAWLWVLPRILFRSCSRIEITEMVYYPHATIASRCRSNNGLLHWFEWWHSDVYFEK